MKNVGGAQVEVIAMKIDVKFTLNKDNSAEAAYANMLDMSFASYNMMKMLQPDLPEVICEACDCGTEIEYRFQCDQELNIEDLEQIFKSALAEGFGSNN